MNPRVKLLTPLLAALLLHATAARAEFEGILQMKFSVATPDGTPMGNGTANIAVSKAGARNEMNMEAPMEMKIIMLTKMDSPDKVYRLNEESKTYTEMDTPSPEKNPNKNPNQETNSYAVKKLGKEKILEFNTDHVMVTHNETTMELWTTKELLDYATYSKLQIRRGRALDEEEMVKALKDAKADGMPIKAIITQPQMKMSLELVKTDKKSVPSSTFEIPAGYTKSGGSPMDHLNTGSSSDPRLQERRKQMQDALKNMTPEQREMFEKAMRQRQNANP